MSLHPAASTVLPLLARVEPVTGESLMSLVARACEANVILRPRELLAPLGLTGRPAFTPFTAEAQTAPLAKLLGVDERAVAERMHGSVPGSPDPTFVAWFGTTLERRFLMAEPRRFAPAALHTCGHHRAAWSVTPLSFCPETFQELLSNCPACGRALGWVKTHGTDRCEHCRAPLAAAAAPYVASDLRPVLTAVTELISTLDGVRAAAVARLPHPFSSWPAGEVFGAVVEFGVACEAPAANRTSPEGKALIWGQPALASPTALVSGYEVLQGWPDSLTTLLRRTCDALASSTERGVLALSDLGLLARHLDRRLPATRLRELLRAAYPIAAAAARAPVKVRKPLSPAARVGARTLTLAEAKTLSGISDRVLRRLQPDGECFRGGRGGRGGAWRLDAERFSKAAVAYHQAITPAEAATRLGVPTYTIKAFVQGKLLSSIRDADALRMAEERLLIRAASLDRLEARLWSTACQPLPGVVRPSERARAYLEGRPDYHSIATALAMARLARSVVLPEQHGEVMMRLLAGHFAPQAWAQAIRGVVQGEVIVRYHADASSWTQRLLVDPTSLEACTEFRRREAPPEDTVVTALSAGMLIGVGGAAVGELAKAGYLQSLRLADIQRFHNDWILSPEIRRRGCMSAYSSLSLPEPSLSTRHLRGWSREVVEANLFPG